MELEITYRSPVDIQIQIIKDYQFNPLVLAIVKNNLEAVKFFVQKMDINLFYATVKPGAYDFNDICILKQQIFPVTYTIINEYYEIFQFLYDQGYSLQRAEHLKLILEEVIESKNPTLIEYVFVHPRTHVLFNYLSYVDRQLLMGYLLISIDHLAHVFEPKFE